MENTLTISVWIGWPVSMEAEIVRVVSLGTTELSEITRLKILFQGSDTLSRPKKNQGDKNQRTQSAEKRI